MTNLTSDLGPILLIIKLVMLVSFLLFFLPLSYTIIIIVSYSQLEFIIAVSRVLYSAIILACIGIGAVITIIKLDLRFRVFVSGLFSAGAISISDDPYLISFAIVLSWLFFETWFIAARTQQLHKEYYNYPRESIERRKLQLLVKDQFVSISFLALIVLSITWPIFLIVENFYIEFGQEFGTLGISTTLMVFLLLYLAQRLSKPAPKK